MKKIRQKVEHYFRDPISFYKLHVMFINSTIFNSLLEKWCVKKASILTLKRTDNCCISTKIGCLNIHYISYLFL